MVHKFLQESVVEATASPLVEPSQSESGLMNLIEHLEPEPVVDVESYYNTMYQRPPPRRQLPDNAPAMALEDANHITAALDDPWSLLPPVDPDSIDWTSLDYEPRIIMPLVTDARVDRLHLEYWTGVNGQYDHRNQWHDWTQTFSVPSYDGDLLHILPYVNIDD